MPGMYEIHDVQVKTVPVFDRLSNQHQVTRVTMWVGDHGPFTHDFGPGQPDADTPESINQWKQGIVAKLMAVAGQ